METIESNNIIELQTISKVEIEKGIENHKKAALQFEAASKCHLEAAFYLENGNHLKAVQSTIEAHDNSLLAVETQKVVVEFITSKLEENY